MGLSTKSSSPRLLIKTKCMWLMHVSGPSHSQQPTVTTCVSSQHEKMMSPASITECWETDKDEEIVPKKGHTTFLETVRVAEV